jgi:TIR domain-containing protein
MRTHPRVFISHASSDAWVARQIEAKARACGAATFLDCEHIEHGDDFEERIIDAAANCTELLVLFTPTAQDRKYVWMEIGMFLGARKRIVGVLYGVKKEEISTDQFTPVALKRVDSVDLNDIDSYFEELSRRVKDWEANNG